jgi:adenylate cyclase
MLGDTVNLASRLQVLNKELATEILISSQTRERLVRSKTHLRHMGSHAIKGKTERVEVFALA